MAIVKTIHCKNGGTIYVHDDCYRDASKEELERRYRRLDEAILAIDRRVQLEQLRAGRAGGKNHEDGRGRGAQGV